MKYIKFAFISIFLSFISFTALAENSSDKSSVEATTQLWANAIESRDARAIANLYDEHAILYATFANKLDTHQEIYNYFVDLAKKKNLYVKFNQQSIRIFNGQIAVNSGKYTFYYSDDSGKSVSVPARYTFVYAKTKGGWTILDHHSSVLPDVPTALS